MVGLSQSHGVSQTNRIEKAEIHESIDNLEAKFDELHASLSDLTARINPILITERPNVGGIAADQRGECSALTLRIRQLHDRMDVVLCTIAALKARIDL